LSRLRAPGDLAEPAAARFRHQRPEARRGRRGLPGRQLDLGRRQPGFEVLLEVARRRLGGDTLELRHRRGRLAGRGGQHPGRGDPHGQPHPRTLAGLDAERDLPRLGVPALGEQRADHHGPGDRRLLGPALVRQDLLGPARERRRRRRVAADQLEDRQVRPRLLGGGRLAELPLDRQGLLVLAAGGVEQALSGEDLAEAERVVGDSGTVDVLAVDRQRLLVHRPRPVQVAADEKDLGDVGGGDRGPLAVAELVEERERLGVARDRRFEVTPEVEVETEVVEDDGGLAAGADGAKLRQGLLEQRRRFRESALVGEDPAQRAQHARGAGPVADFRIERLRPFEQLAGAREIALLARREGHQLHRLGGALAISRGLEERLRFPQRVHRLVVLSQVAEQHRFPQSRPRHHQRHPQLLTSRRGPAGAGQGRLDLALAIPGQRLGEIDARVERRRLGQAPQGLERHQRRRDLAAFDLRRRQPQTDADVVGKGRVEGAVHAGGLLPFPRRRVRDRLDFEAGGLGEASRELPSPGRRLAGLVLVAQGRADPRQRGVRQRVIARRRDRLLEQGAGAQDVELPQPRQTLAVAPQRFAVARQGSLGRQRLAGRQGAGAELLAKPRRRPVDQGEEGAGGAGGAARRQDLAASRVLHAQVDPQQPGRRLAEVPVRPPDEPVDAEGFPQPREIGLGQLAEPAAGAGARRLGHLAAADHPDLAAGRQCRRQHLAEGGRQPGAAGIGRALLETEDGHRRAHRGRGNRRRRRLGAGAPAQPKPGPGRRHGRRHPQRQAEAPAARARRWSGIRLR